MPPFVLNKNNDYFKTEINLTILILGGEDFKHATLYLISHSLTCNNQIGVYKPTQCWMLGVERSLEFLDITKLFCRDVPPFSKSTNGVANVQASLPTVFMLTNNL